MLFNSYEFIFLFLPVTLIVYFWLNKYNKNYLVKGWLVIASLYFYSYFHKSYLFLILSSIIVNYFLGKQLQNDKFSNKQRKLLLMIGVIFNIGVLGYFKYYDFFISNINLLFKSNIPVLNILLPLGISFFTFQQLAYLIDMYKRYHLVYNFLDYCLFVTFFPQLIAGPIVLPTEMLPQFESKENKVVNWENINKGLYIFSIGLAKKILIADNVANFANVGFDVLEKLNFIEAWFTSLSYTLQLYFDFSGYCDMAMGIGLMFNIILPVNFNSPYKSTNIQEFWKRWHITLGRFLINYLYIPLGGNRKGEKRTLINLFIVFLVSGIWHGAGWTFIIWGLLHGISIIIHRLWKDSGRKLNKYIGWFITFNLINIFWIFFRAKNLKIAFSILFNLFDFKDFYYIILNTSKIGEITKKFREVSSSSSYLGNKIDFLIFVLSFFITFFYQNSTNKLERMNFTIFNSFELNIYFWMSVPLMTRFSQFLYFNF